MPFGTLPPRFRSFGALASLQGIGLDPTQGVGAAWQLALPALREFLAANYDGDAPHNQVVMASPPTVAVSASLPAGLAVSYAINTANQDTAALRILGGRMFNAGGNSRIYSADLGATGGNGGTNDGKECSGWRAEVTVDATKVAFRVGPTTSGYRFIVDGQYVSLTETNTVGTTGTTSEYMQLDFTSVGGRAVRRIAIEGEQTCALVQVWVPTGESCTRPADEVKRIVFAGDSFTYGTDASHLGSGYGWVAADKLGFRHSLNSGAGGTGYVATSGSSVKLADRLADINDTAPHDIIVVAMGINDIGQSAASVTAQVTAVLTSLRANNPAAQIFAVGPWDVNAPSAPVSGYSTTKAAIVAGIPSGQGITFLDPEGVAFVNTDGTHPDTAGHTILGDWLAGGINTAIAA